MEKLQFSDIFLQKTVLFYFPLQFFIIFYDQLSSLVVKGHFSKLCSLFDLKTYLEVDARSQDGNQCADAVDRNERKPIFINTQHHLEAAADRLDVLVVLK